MLRAVILHLNSDLSILLSVLVELIVVARPAPYILLQLLVGLINARALVARVRDLTSHI